MQTNLGGETFPFLRTEVLQPERLIRSSVVPLAVFVEEALCQNNLARLVIATRQKRTGRLVELCSDVRNRPAVSGIDPWIGAAPVYRGQVVSMFFALGAPGCGGLLEDAIVSDPRYMRIKVPSVSRAGRTESVATKTCSSSAILRDKYKNVVHSLLKSWR